MRTCFVPAVLSLAPELNLWPRKPPVPKKLREEDEDEDDFFGALKDETAALEVRDPEAAAPLLG